MISSSPLIKCEIGAITTSDNAFKSSCDDVDSFSSVLALSGKPFFSSSKGSSEKCSSHLKPLTPICFCMFSSSSWSRSDCVFFAQTDTAVPSVVPRNSTSRSVPRNIVYDELWPEIRDILSIRSSEDDGADFTP